MQNPFPKLCAIAMALVFACLPARAIDIVSATVTVTNPPVVGWFITVNSSTRTWSTSGSATTIQTNSGTAGSATNLWLHFGSYPAAGVSVTLVHSNQVRFTALPAATLAVTHQTNWAEIIYSTQTVASAQVVRVPMSVEASAQRTNMASQLARDLEAYSPTAFATGTTLLGNYVDKSTAQVVTGAKTLLSVTTSNLVNLGSAVSSPGSGPDSEEFGSGASATNDSALAVGFGALAGAPFSIAVGNSATAIGNSSSAAIGNSSTATGNNSLAVGSASSATQTNSLAVGNNSSASGAASIAIGTAATAAGSSSLAVGDLSEASNQGIAIGANAFSTGIDSIAIGRGAESTYQRSIAIGQGATTSASNQIVIGDAAHTLVIPGVVNPSVVTGATYHGTPALSGGTLTTPTLLTPTSSNSTEVGYYSLREVRLPRSTHTTLANGGNAGVVFTNTFNRITNGPTASFTIYGVAGGADGRLLLLYNLTGQNMTVAHQSGSEATAANRIITMTGSDVATTGDGTAMLVYDSTVARWILVNSSP